MRTSALPFGYRGVERGVTAGSAGWNRTSNLSLRVGHFPPGEKSCRAEGAALDRSSAVARSAALDRSSAVARRRGARQVERENCLRPSEETIVFRSLNECLTVRPPADDEQREAAVGRAGVEPAFLGLLDFLGRAKQSPRPDSNRILPCTRRVLDLSSFAGRARGARPRGARRARADGEAVRRADSARGGGLLSNHSDDNQLQRKESNLRSDRLTAGCLTIRLRWKLLRSHERCPQMNRLVAYAHRRVAVRKNPDEHSSRRTRQARARGELLGAKLS